MRYRTSESVVGCLLTGCPGRLPLLQSGSDDALRRLTVPEAERRVRTSDWTGGVALGDGKSEHFFARAAAKDGNLNCSTPDWRIFGEQDDSGAGEYVGL